MNPKIYKPEERVSQEVIDKLREDEDYFEQILPNGAEGSVSLSVSEASSLKPVDLR